MAQLLLIVRLAGERVAVPAEEIEAVVEIEALTPIPCTAAHVAGLAALRSRVLTVIDCDASLGMARASEVALHDAMVVVTDGHPYALLVDSVEDVLETNGDVRPVRTSLAPGWRRVARGTVDAAGDLLLLVDVRALISGPVAQAA